MPTSAAHRRKAVRVTAREVFIAAREAAIRLRELDVRSDEMRMRIGLQGHGYGESTHGSMLDPMRKVDDLLDWEADESRAIRQSSSQAIGEAEQLLRGMEALGASEAAETLRLRFVKARSASQVAAMLGQPEALVVRMCDEAIDWCESVGIAKLKEAGR